MEDDILRLLDVIMQHPGIPEKPKEDDTYLEHLDEMLQFEVEELKKWQGESDAGGQSRDRSVEGFQGPLSGADYPGIKPALQAAAKWAEIKLRDLQSRFEAGDPKALFEAVRFCHLFGVPMPDWVGLGILDGMQKVENFELGSWDDAYGAPYPKNTRLPERRRRLERANAVAYEVERLSAAGTAIDDFIWEKVAKNLNAKNKNGELFEGRISGREAKNIWHSDIPVVTFVKGRLARLRRGKKRKSRLIRR